MNMFLRHGDGSFFRVSDVHADGNEVVTSTGEKNSRRRGTRTWRSCPSRLRQLRPLRRPATRRMKSSPCGRGRTNFSPARLRRRTFAASRRNLPGSKLAGSCTSAKSALSSASPGIGDDAAGGLHRIVGRLRVRGLAQAVEREDEALGARGPAPGCGTCGSRKLLELPTRSESAWRSWPKSIPARKT